MAMAPHLDKDVSNLSKFIDFDKNHNIFYNNLYIEDYDFVIKIPLALRKEIQEKIKIEKFNLAKYIYLLDYE